MSPTWPCPCVYTHTHTHWHDISCGGSRIEKGTMSKKNKNKKPQSKMETMLEFFLFFVVALILWCLFTTSGWISTVPICAHEKWVVRDSGCIVPILLLTLKSNLCLFTHTMWMFNFFRVLWAWRHYLLLWSWWRLTLLLVTLAESWSAPIYMKTMARVEKQSFSLHGLFSSSLNQPLLFLVLLLLACPERTLPFHCSFAKAMS